MGNIFTDDGQKLLEQAKYKSHIVFLKGELIIIIANYQLSQWNENIYK